VPRELFAAILERVSQLRLAPSTLRAHGQPEPDGKDRGSIFFFRVESYFWVTKQVFRGVQTELPGCYVLSGGFRSGFEP